MAKDVDEVIVGVDGVVATGVYGVAVAPIDAETPLGVTWTDQGYVTEDGVTESTSQTTEVLRAWQRATRVRTLITEGEVTFQFTLMQTNADTLALYYGGEVDEDGSIIQDPTVERPRIAFCLDIIDGDKIVRKYAPNAQVTEVGDQVAQTGGEVGYDVTVTCSYDEELGGAVQHWFSELAGS